MYYIGMRSRFRVFKGGWPFDPKSCVSESEILTSGPRKYRKRDTGAVCKKYQTSNKCEAPPSKHHQNNKVFPFNLLRFVKKILHVRNVRLNNNFYFKFINFINQKRNWQCFTQLKSNIKLTKLFLLIY